MSEIDVKKHNKKHYVKPEAKKHKAAAIASGSSDSCGMYHKTSYTYTYWH